MAVSLDFLGIRPEDLELLGHLPADLQAEADSCISVLLHQLSSKPWANYPHDPVGYARDILGITLTDQQREIILAILDPPYMVHVDSAHGTGKTFLGAVMANWWYDQFDPGVVITTAPTERDVIDLLWTEIRLLRSRGRERFPYLPVDFIGPAAAEMRTSNDHWAKGYTSRKGESFQGRHRSRMLFIFDENEGIDASYYTTTKTMFKPEAGHAWFSIGNPTTTSSQAYLETQAANADGSSRWRLFRLSALDHPNIKAQLAGLPPIIPNAVTLPQLEAWISDWTRLITPAEAQVTDFQWPPGSGHWRRPGPIGCSRILGCRPTLGTDSVWSADLFEACERAAIDIQISKLPEIGCDVARFGDDDTAIHVRWGSVSLHHESHNGLTGPQVVARLKQLADEYCALANAVRKRVEPSTRQVLATEIVVKVDADGLGGMGVVDWRGPYRFVEVSGASRANADQDYPNRRSELWFDVAERAKRGLLSLKKLPQEVRQKIKMQALAPTYTLDAAGRRVVEPKDKTKKKLGHSPDHMDAVNLAYTEWYSEPASWVGPSSKIDTKKEPQETGRSGIMGRERDEDDFKGWMPGRKV